MNPVVEAAGWTLLHFVWQGAAIAILTAIVLELLAFRSARARYLVACLSLAAMLLAPVVTILLIPRPAGTPAMASPENRGSTSYVPAARADLPGVATAPVSDSAWTAWSIPARTDRLLTAIVALWVAGVVVLLARMAGGWWRVRRLHRLALAAAASGWQQTCERLAARMGVTAAIHVIESTLVDAPAVIGWLRPVVVLPVAALAGLAPAQVEAILAHELAHIRRHDYVINLLQTLAETLLFYHPAVWWISSRVRSEREYCCDDAAVALSGDAVGYAAALAQLEASRSAWRPLAMAATGGSLLNRIGRILQVPPNDPSRSPGWIVTLTLTVLFTAGAGGMHRIPAMLAEKTADAAAALAAPPSPQTAPQPPIPPVPPTSAKAPTPPTPPTPPEPPAAPEPPTPPAVPMPADGDNLHVQLRDDEFRMRWSTGLRSVDVRGAGEVVFTADLTDIAKLSPGGYLILRDWTALFPRTIEIRSEAGSLRRRYYVAGFERPWTAEVQRQLAERLPSLIRRSGLGARSRTRQILASKGINGVLDEISLLEGDYARRLYFRELIGAERPLDERDLVRALTIAGTTIDSDYYLAETLREVAAVAAANPAAAKAYVDALDTVNSDYEHRRALVAFVRAERATPAVTDLAMRSAGTMRSDYERAETLRAAVQVGRLGQTDAVFTAVEGMRSDYEKRRVLSALIEQGTTSPEASQGLLNAAATIDSDYECATLLMSFIKRQKVDSSTRQAFFSAVETIRSSYERKRVLTELVSGDAIGGEIVQSVIDAVATMTSDYERAETLLSLLHHQPSLDSTTRNRLIDVVDRMRSDYEQGRVLVALVKAERR